MAGIPVVLETPQDEAGYAAEIAWLRSEFEENDSGGENFM